jgi:predicted heme/steroid binding protein
MFGRLAQKLRAAAQGARGGAIMGAAVAAGSLATGGVVLAAKKSDEFIPATGPIKTLEQLEPVARPDLPTFSLEEVQSHYDKDTTGAWVTYRGAVYDVSKFISAHPGGYVPSHVQHSIVNALAPIIPCAHDFTHAPSLSSRLPPVLSSSGLLVRPWLVVTTWRFSGLCTVSTTVVTLWLSWSVTALGTSLPLMQRRRRRSSSLVTLTRMTHHAIETVLGLRNALSAVRRVWISSVTVTTPPMRSSTSATIGECLG